MTEERDALPLLAISQKRELTEKIQGLTEEIEELKNEETAILRTFHKEKAMQKMTAHPSKRGAISIQTRKEISDTITAADEAARRHAEREEAFASEYQTEYSHFHEVLSEASTLDPHALADARLAIRPEKEKAAFDEIHKAFPEKLPVFMRHDTIYAVDRDLKNLGLERPLLRMQRSIQDGLEQEPQRRTRGKVEKLQKLR